MEQTNNAIVSSWERTIAIKDQWKEDYRTITIEDEGGVIYSQTRPSWGYEGTMTFLDDFLERLNSGYKSPDNNTLLHIVVGDIAQVEHKAPTRKPQPMQKILDTRLKTVIQLPTQNKLRLKWRELTKRDGVVYIPYREAVPDPLYALATFERNFSSLGIEPPTIQTPLWSKELKRKEITLPKSKGGWRILSLLQESPQGLTVRAKIMTRLEDNETQLKIFLRSDDNSHCKHRQETANKRYCPRSCSRCRNLGSFPYLAF